MKVTGFKALWGMQGSLESQFERISKAGYHGVESPLPHVMEKILGFPADEAQFKSLLKHYGFQYIAMIFTSGPDHAASFEEQANRALSYAPVMINSHSAKDDMSEREQAVFFEKTLAVERKLGIAVGHETHRGRAMFTPWTTARLLREYPELKLTADFSHWVCVCESLLQDQEENLALAISRTIHIHARVGFAQGPQVPHPAAPEYSAELETHKSWWERMIQARSDAGADHLTFTPEFGPPDYMPRLPFTNQPVVDLWEVCSWMKNHFEQMHT